MHTSPGEILIFRCTPARPLFKLQEWLVRTAMQLLGHAAILSRVYADHDIRHAERSRLLQEKWHALCNLYSLVRVLLVLYLELA